MLKNTVQGTLDSSVNTSSMYSLVSMCSRILAVEELIHEQDVVLALKELTE